MFELFYSSGLRLSELTGLDLDDVNLQAGEAQVTGKGRKTRIVPVGKAALDAINAWLPHRLPLMTRRAIIEKETGRGDERQRISCVFHNRLAKGMKLQTDPTVMYATMLRKGGRWSNNITRKDLSAPHPYNTYAVASLPPGPIANPGEAVLAAVISPSDCRDLYFVSRNDGNHVFCPDLRCHQAAVREWQVEFFRARRAARDEQATPPMAPPRG